MVLHNKSNYDHHFLAKQWAEEFAVQFRYLRDNTNKYTTFLVPMKKQGKRKTIKYKIRFIDSIRFMPTSQHTMGKV